MGGVQWSQCLHVVILFLLDGAETSEDNNSTHRGEGRPKYAKTGPRRMRHHSKRYLLPLRVLVSPWIITATMATHTMATAFSNRPDTRSSDWEQALPLTLLCPVVSVGSRCVGSSRPPGATSPLSTVLYCKAIRGAHGAGSA